MKKLHVSLARACAVMFFLISLQACKKDQQVSEISAQKQSFQNNFQTPIIAQELPLNTIKEGTLATRAAADDQLIDDDLMDSQAQNTINIGQRIGKIETSPSNADEVNTRSTYVVGTNNYNNYPSGERIFKVEIPDDGSYTVQLTPKNANVDLDLFVVGSENSNVVLKNEAGKYLASTFMKGQTETVQLTKKGTYFLVVDGYNGNTGKFMISLSKDVPLVIETQEDKPNNRVRYRFSQKSCIACLQSPIKSWEVYNSFTKVKGIYIGSVIQGYFSHKADFRITAVLTNNTKIGFTVYP